MKHRCLSTARWSGFFEVGACRAPKGKGTNMIKIVGIALLVAGLLGLVYGGFSYNKETVGAKLGPIELKVTEKRTIDVPIWGGIGAIVAGAVLLALGRRKG